MEQSDWSIASRHGRIFLIPGHVLMLTLINETPTVRGLTTNNDKLYTETMIFL